MNRKVVWIEPWWAAITGIPVTWFWATFLPSSLNDTAFGFILSQWTHLICNPRVAGNSPCLRSRSYIARWNPQAMYRLDRVLVKNNAVSKAVCAIVISAVLDFHFVFYLVSVLLINKLGSTEKLRRIQWFVVDQCKFSPVWLATAATVTVFG